MLWNLCEGSDCRWSEVRNGKDNCPFNLSPGNLRVATGISCFLSLTGLLSLMLSILVVCALAEMVNALTLYQSVLPMVHAAASMYFREHSWLWSWFSHCCSCVLCSRSWCLKFEETDDGMEMQFKPRDLFLLASQAVERNWKPAEVASVHGCLLAPDDCLDGSRLQHRARQGNEWIHWQIFRYIRFLLTIVSFQTVNTPKCHMLLNRQVQYTPQPRELVGFYLCIFLPQRLYLFSKNSIQWKQPHTWPCNLEFQMVLSRN